MTWHDKVGWNLSIIDDIINLSLFVKQKKIQQSLEIAFMFLLSNEAFFFQSAENISTECKRRSRKTKHKSSSYQSKAEVWILYKSLRERAGTESSYLLIYNYQGKLEFIQTKPGPRSHLSLPHPLPHFQHLLLDHLPGGDPQLPDRPHDGAGGVKQSLRGQTAAQPMPQCQCHDGELHYK